MAIPALNQAIASVVADFSDNFETFCWMPGLQYIDLSNLGVVMDEILRRANLDSHDPQYWDADKYVVVSAVYAAPNVTQVIAQGTNRSIQIQAQGVNKAIGLNDANATFAVTSSDSTSVYYIAKLAAAAQADAYYTPFIELKKINWNIFGHRWWGDP